MSNLLLLMRVKVNNLFGFRPERSIMEPIFILSQMAGKYMAVKKSFYFRFVNLEKAYD